MGAIHLMGLCIGLCNTCRETREWPGRQPAGGVGHPWLLATGDADVLCCTVLSCDPYPSSWSGAVACGRQLQNELSWGSCAIPSPNTVTSSSSCAVCLWLFAGCCPQGRPGPPLRPPSRLRPRRQRTGPWQRWAGGQGSGKGSRVQGLRARVWGKGSTQGFD